MAPTLVYLGGASLTFGSGTGRQIVKRGEPFEVSAELAKILLADPHVTAYAAPAEHSARNVEAVSPLEQHRALKARAKELGLPATGKVADLTAAIAAEETRLAKEAAAAYVPQSTLAVVHAGETIVPPTPGAITLGDLPASAKVGS